MKFLLILSVLYLGDTTPTLSILPTLQTHEACSANGVALMLRLSKRKDGTKAIKSVDYLCQDTTNFASELQSSAAGKTTGYLLLVYRRLDDGGQQVIASPSILVQEECAMLGEAYKLRFINTYSGGKIVREITTRCHYLDADDLQKLIASSR
jgi:hypothetical protein